MVVVILIPLAMLVVPLGILRMRTSGLCWIIWPSIVEGYCQRYIHRYLDVNIGTYMYTYICVKYI